MALKNPTIYWLAGIFIVVNIVDAITAYYIAPGEYNPLTILTGSMLILYIFKILLVSAVVYCAAHNIYPSHFILFLFIMIMVLGSFAVGLGAWSNIQGMQHPELVAEAAAVPAKEKIVAYSSVMTIIYVIPIGLSLLGFKCYEWALKKTVIEKKKKHGNNRDT